MKRTVVSTVCILCVLFLGGIFFYVYPVAVTAQTNRTESESEKKARSDAVSTLKLLDPKVHECSERELLEMKVTVARQIFEYVNDAYQLGAPTGRTVLLLEAQIELADAEIELYRYTNERVKLSAALGRKADAATNKLRAVNAEFEAGVATLDALSRAKAQLLDAVLEQKRGAILAQMP